MEMQDEERGFRLALSRLLSMITAPFITAGTARMCTSMDPALAAAPLSFCSYSNRDNCQLKYNTSQKKPSKQTLLRLSTE